MLTLSDNINPNYYKLIPYSKELGSVLGSSI